MWLIRLILCIAVLDLNAQTFSGEVSYLVIVDSAERVVKDTVRVFYAENGNYSVSAVSNPGLQTVYITSENLLYTVDSVAMMVAVSDAGADLESAMGLEPVVYALDSVYRQNGHVWNIVEVRWKAGRYRYYYDSGLLKVNADLFKGHHYDQFYAFLTVSGSLPTRIDKIVNGMANVSLEIVDFKEYSPDPLLFQIPRMKPIPGLTSFYPNKKLYAIDN